METYIARQPIFNRNKQVAGYELLYRDDDTTNAAPQIDDGDQATCRLLSDAITVFGLSRLTNARPAFVNFTRNIILNDFVLLANPEEIVVELLEDQLIDQALFEKLRTLREKGYTLALDDYVGDESYDSLLPLVHIVKVDFLQTSEAKRMEIARRMKRLKITMLAEKVETEENFRQAMQMGYALFQGYYFEKPVTMRKKLPPLTQSTSWRVFVETQRRDVSLERCANIIHADVAMTYRLLKHVQSLRFYRNNKITAILEALVVMGTEEIRRWVLLILAREENVAQSDETVREAYLRGSFIESLMNHTPMAKRSEDGFLLGMFSLLDKVVGMPLRALLDDVTIQKDVADALLGKKDSPLSAFLEYAVRYEKGDISGRWPSIEVEDGIHVPALYMACIAQTDYAFQEVEGDPVPCKPR